MSAGCVRWALSHTMRAVCGGRLGYWKPASRFILCCERSPAIAFSWRSPCSTAVGDIEQTAVPKKKKQDPQANATVNAVGRKIPQRQIEVVSETGENLGIMHRAEVIKIMDTQGLKLVLLSKHKDPPVYQLMSGKQIHEKQLELREKQKAKAAPVQVKDLTFSSNIGPHDLSTKLKQVESWLEKKHHVKLTIRSGRRQAAVNLDTTLEKMVQEMEMMVGYVSKPRVIRDGQAATCILRLPSAKELSKKDKSKAAAAAQSDDSGSETTHSKTSDVSNTDTTQESIQQRADS